MNLLALLLAQMCVAEISLFAPTGECVIMWHTQDDLAEQKKRTLEKQVTLYTPLFKKTKRGKWRLGGPRREGIRALTASAERPAAWRDRWDGEVWLAKYRAAEMFLAGETLNPCPGVVSYGGRCDDDGKAACDPPAACLERVDCGETLQAYWRPIKGCRPGDAVAPAGHEAGVKRHVIPALVAAGGT